jgi:hypothetical protein
MGHYCRICGRNKPNEKFSGRGHKNHICKECSRKPKSEIDEIDLLAEISGFLRQSNISKINIKRLSDLTKFEKANIVEMAEIVIEVAKVKPHKRRRLRFLAKERRDLFEKLKMTGLIYAHY